VTGAKSSGPPQLQRALTLRDLVLFNLVAVIGLRWLATSAKAGPSSLALWGLATLLFFVPQGLAVVELASRFPKEGGIYVWTRQALGEGHGFLCGWCYWVNNVLYYPNLLISTAVIATFIVGRGESTLGQSWAYVLPATLVALWLAVALNVIGLGTGKWLQNAGGIGTYLPGAILVLLGGAAFFSRPSANPITPAAVVPDLSKLSELNLWASIAFAFAGLELGSTMGDEVEQPARNLPRSIFISAPLVAAMYLLGTGAVLWLVPVGDLNLVSGFLQAISAGSRTLFGTDLWWIAPLCALSYTVGTLGGVGAWLVGPARVAFTIGLDRYFPPAFGRVHPRWRTPYVAILVQAGLGTLFLVLSVLGRGTTVEKVYLILLDTQLLIYFIPYIYLFVTFLIHRRRRAGGDGVVEVPGGAAGALLVGLSGLAITLFAMIVAMIPPPDTPDWWAFELKVVGGAGSFVLLGGIIYWRARRRRPD
jgi:amino acid transporter